MKSFSVASNILFIVRNNKADRELDLKLGYWPVSLNMDYMVFRMIYPPAIYVLPGFRRKFTTLITSSR